MPGMVAAAGVRCGIGRVNQEKGKGIWRRIPSARIGIGSETACIWEGMQAVSF